MSTGLLYHYFPSKQSLFAAAYEHLADRFIAGWLARSGDDPWVLIDSALGTYLEYAQRHPGVVGLLLGRHDAAESLNDRLNERVAALVAQAFDVPASDATRRLALRAWTAFVDQAVLGWLAHQRPSRGQIKSLALRTLRAALADDDAGMAPGMAPRTP